MRPRRTSGVVDDGDARRGLVHHLRQLRALHPRLGVVERREVPGGQLGDRLGAHHHPGVLDDEEHLRDAVVDVSDQPADRRLLLPEGELAGGRHLEAHLLLHVGDEDTVAIAELTRLQVHVVLRHEEEGQSLGARSAHAFDAHGACEHEVDDVVRHVVLGRRDEALDAFDVPRAVGLRESLRAPSAHVGSGVRLGEHHRSAPLAIDDELGPALLVRVADLVEDGGESGAGHVEEGAGIGAEEHLRGSPAQRW